MNRRGSSSFTVMVSRGAGRLRVFRVSPLFLISLAVLVVLVFIGSLVMLHMYLEEVQRKNEEMRELDALKKQSEEMRESLYQSREHLKLLKEYMSNLELKAARNTPPKEDPDRTETSPAGDKAATHDEGLVDIEDMSIQKKTKVLHVNFKLVNVKKDNGAVGGYVHIVPLYEKNKEFSKRASQETPLREGLPVDYKEGQRFLIKRFKPMGDRLAFQAEMGPPSWLLVIVYNDSGDLILRKTFALDELS